MLRSAAGKVMWVGRATVFLIGLAVILAFLFGVASLALGANGKPFILGQKNNASKVSKLVKSGVGPALNLQVGSGPPMAVNSSEVVSNLNADRLDSKDATGLGVNGLERVETESAENSSSPKQVTASCPSGKVLVGTGFDIFGGKSGDAPNAQTDVVMDFVIPGSSSVTVAAYEEVGTADAWRVKAIAICATAP